MPQTLTALRTMHLLSPDLIPGDVAREVDGGERDRFRARLPLLPPAPAGREASEVALNELLAQISADGTASKTMPLRADDAAHDAYFHIGRLEGDPFMVLIGNCIEARLLVREALVLSDLGAEDATLRPVDESLIGLLHHFVGEDTCATDRVALLRSGGTSSISAMQRWVSGHQLFAVLTQGLIFAFKSMADAVRASKREAASYYADLAISLLHGSAETFRFTGGFGPDEYEAVIRPSMMPPLVPVCLSGLMSIDHRYLVQLLRTMRPALLQFREWDRNLHDALASALNQVYDAHIHVCQRFVGEKPSIRTAESTETPGSELLESFRKLRLKPFEHA